MTNQTRCVYAYHSHTESHRTTEVVTSGKNNVFVRLLKNSQLSFISIAHSCRRLYLNPPLWGRAPRLWPPEVKWRTWLWGDPNSSRGDWTRSVSCEGNSRSSTPPYHPNPLQPEGCLQNVPFVAFRSLKVGLRLVGEGEPETSLSLIYLRAILLLMPRGFLNKRKWRWITVAIETSLLVGLRECSTRDKRLSLTNSFNIALNFSK